MSVSSLAAVVVVVLGFTNVAAAASPVDVYTLSGQSNMYGLARLRDVHPERRRPARDCAMWNGEEFVPFAPVATEGLVGTLFGPELSFCQAMAWLRPDRRSDLIKHAVPGRGLHHGWLETKWVPGPPGPGRANFYPGESPSDPNVGRHYAELREKIEAALAALAALKVAGIGFEIHGALWMQGETDAVNPVAARAYAAGLARLKKRLEEDLGLGALPVVFGQVLLQVPESPFYAFRRRVRESQARAHWDSLSDAGTVSGESAAAVSAASE